MYSLSEGILRLKDIKFCRFLSPRNWLPVIKDLFVIETQCHLVLKVIPDKRFGLAICHL